MGIFLWGDLIKRAKLVGVDWVGASQVKWFIFEGIDFA